MHPSTDSSDLTLSFLQDHKDLTSTTEHGKAAKAFLNRLDPGDFPCPWLMTMQDCKEHVVKKIQAGEVGKEYVGSHGVPGLAYPPLEAHSDNYERLLSAPACLAMHPRLPCNTLTAFLRVRSTA